MAQITIYIDDELDAEMKRLAEAENLSKSRWVTNLIREKISTTWPQEIIEMAGTWTDFPDLETIRATEIDDRDREPL